MTGTLTGTMAGAAYAAPELWWATLCIASNVFKDKNLQYVFRPTARWQAAGGTGVAPPHLSIGFNSTYVFLTDLLPRAIKVHGGIDAEALRKAALETDIAIGGTMRGYGVKFYPPGHRMVGQNEPSVAVVMQYVDGKTNIVWPKQLRTAEPILPLPAGDAYAP